MSLLLFYEAYTCILGMVVGLRAYDRRRNGILWGVLSAAFAAVTPLVLSLSHVKPYLHEIGRWWGIEWGVFCFIPWPFIIAMITLSILPESKDRNPYRQEYKRL